MEKTDSLHIANEGLATRICKLVALIQKQNNTLDSLDRETIGGDDATTPATGKSYKSRRRRSIRHHRKENNTPRVPRVGNFVHCGTICPATEVD